MRIGMDPVRLTATCDFCWTINELTITAVADEQQVHCSTCGAELGSLGDLRRRNKMLARRDLDRTATAPLT
jgi:hypothetical protein